MTRLHSRSAPRAAFTFVELIVVILIIAILVSLAASGIATVMGRVPETQTRTEITELDTALRAFMSDFGLTDPPPCSLTLYPNVSSYQAGDPSYAFLQKMFGKNVGQGVTINWGGTNGGGTLNAEQCLVFYLGGINNQGFSYNKINPNPTLVPGQKTHGPYFTFQPNRLKVGNGGFYVYIDPWQTKAGPNYATLGGTPYTYFSSMGYNNGYSTYAAGTSGYGATPYYFGANQFFSSNTYQIISAGKDGTFGNGNMSTGAATGAGADDQANFSSTLLGKGQN